MRPRTEHHVLQNAMYISLVEESYAFYFKLINIQQLM